MVSFRPKLPPWIRVKTGVGQARAEAERQHPDYRKAVDAELEVVKHGDRNYPGIGWPGKNGRVK